MSSLDDRSAPPTWLIVVAFLTVYIVWGSTYLAIRFAVASMPPLLMAGARFVIAGSLMYPFVRGQQRGPLTARHWRDAAIVGGLLLLGGNGLVCMAEETVPSGLTALMIATVPLWMVVLDWAVFRGPRPTRGMIAGITTGLIGVYLLVGNGASGDAVDPRGAALLVIACSLWSLGSLFSRRATLPRSPFLTNAMEMFSGGLLLILAGTLMGEWSRVRLEAFTWQSWLALVYLFVFGSIVALSAYVWLLQVSTPARVSTYAYVNPVIAMFLGAAFGDQVLSPRIFVAAAVIVTAVVILTQTGRKPRGVTPERPIPEPQSAEAKAALSPAPVNAERSSS